MTSQPCGFIEVFKSKNRPKLIHSPGPQPIKMLDKNIKEIQQSKELTLIGVWKIKMKSNVPNPRREIRSKPEEDIRIEGAAGDTVGI
jgi:hypothetical protein